MEQRVTQDSSRVNIDLFLSERLYAGKQLP